MIGGYSPWFNEELSRRVLQKKIDKSMELGDGFAADFPDYRYAVGFIAGMLEALDIADEIKKEQEAA